MPNQLYVPFHSTIVAWRAKRHSQIDPSYLRFVEVVAAFNATASVFGSKISIAAGGRRPQLAR